MKKLSLVMALAILVSIPFTAKALSPAVGKIVFSKGEATVLRLEDGKIHSLTHLAFNADILAMDTLETKNGQMKILFNDQTVMSLKENSKVIITEHVYLPKQGVRKSIFDILKGKVRTIVEKIPNATDSDVQLRTASAVAGIRGTDVGVIIDGKIVKILCFDGLIDVWLRLSPEQKMSVAKGLYATIQDGKLPTTLEEIPEDLFNELLVSSSIQDILDSMDDVAEKDEDRNPEQQGDALQEGQGRYAGPRKQRLVEALLFNPLLPGGNTNVPSTLAPATATGQPTGEPGPLLPTLPPAPPIPTPPAPEPPAPPPPTDTPVRMPLGFPMPG